MLPPLPFHLSGVVVVLPTHLQGAGDVFLHLGNFGGTGSVALEQELCLADPQVQVVGRAGAFPVLGLPKLGGPVGQTLGDADALHSPAGR